MVSTRWTDKIGTRKLPRCWHVTNFWNKVEIIALRLVLTVVHKIVVTRRMPAGPSWRQIGGMVKFTPEDRLNDRSGGATFPTQRPTNRC